jgi:hypothetical protein
VPGGDLMCITGGTRLRHGHRALGRRRIAAGLALCCHVTLLGAWIAEYAFTAIEQTCDVMMNAVPIISGWNFVGDPAFPRRSTPSTASAPRFIGLQTHNGRVLFHNVQWKPI